MTRFAKRLRAGASRMRDRLVRFRKETRASIAVEMAFILPIFASMAFLTWDAGTVYTQYNRSVRNIYSLGDIISTQRHSLTCNRLDLISELVYESYAEGNWARRQRSGDGDDFNTNGAPDFRFIIRMIEAETRPNGSVRGRVLWEYRRHGGNARADNLRNIPNSLRIDGMRFIMVEGNIIVRPAMNYLGIFELDPANNRVHKRMDVDRYFPLRFVPSIDLVEQNNDEYDSKCISA